MRYGWCAVWSLILVLLMVSAASVQAETLRRGIRYEPATLDPHKYNTHYEAGIIHDLFEGLVTVDADGKPAPGVASKWTPSANGLTWTFVLRPDLKWSDGTPFTAADVTHSFRRLLNPKTAATFAPLFYVIKNARAVNTGKAAPDMLGVTAPSPTAIEIQLENPTPYLPELLANAFASIVPEHAITKFGDAWIKPDNAVSNGAFVLKEWTPQNRIVLAPNPNYREAAKTKLDGVVYFPSADLDSAATRFRAGELDVQSDFPTSRRESLQSEMPNAVHLDPALETFYLALNTSNPKLSDRRVRMALSLALDRDVLTDKVMRDGARAAHSLVPPAVKDYVPALTDFRTESMATRLERARGLLAEVGYGPDKPLAIAFTHSTVGEIKRLAVAIAAMLKPINVEVFLLGTEGKVMFANMRQGNYEMAYAGWSADFDDPASFLYLLQSGVASNYSRYSNPAYDALLTKAAKTGDRKARSELLHQAEAIAIADMPILPIAFGVSKALVAPQVKGWHPNASDVHLSRYLTIDRQ